MSNRIILVKEETGSSVRQNQKPAIYAVLTENFREEEFTGTLEECQRYLQETCPNGGCE